MSALDNRPSQIPVASYATANSQAFAANARSRDAFAANLVDPDDFYRSYQVPPPASTDATHPPSPSKDPMASTVTASRQPLSLRSNGTTPTPKHTPTSPTGRNALRPSLRSASNPTENRLGKTAPKSSVVAGNGLGTAGAHPLSVKDLRKKFDQTASQSAATVRKVTPKQTRAITPNSGNVRAPGAGNNTTSYSVLRATPTRDTGHETGRASGVRSAQRPKPAARESLSTSSQSFASRISRPQNSASSTTQASKSTTRLSPTSSSQLPTSLPTPPRNGLLFGEILPEEIGSVTAGFGIQNNRPRRISDSNMQDLSKSRLRSFSDPDIEPPSPTDWYRAAASEHEDPDVDTFEIVKSHSRAQSDLPGPKDTLSRPDYAAARQISDFGATSPISPTSRLPIFKKRLSTQSNSSAVSTRSNSPAALKYTTVSGRNSRQQGLTATRSKTPTARSITPTTGTKTPSQTAGSGRKAPPSNITTPNSNSRLNAYVSVTAPRLSPSLRSSRPRQSVATATTAASRMRVSEATFLPQKLGQRGTSKADDSSAPTNRRRKVSVGPIDFAQRRETIKLAYSKSIKEIQAKEAKEARQAALDKRKYELEAVALAKSEAVATPEAATEVDVATATVSPDEELQEEESSRYLEETSVHREKTMLAEPLKITTNLSSLQPPIEEVSRPSLERDSPTFGMPGSFPGVGSYSLDGEEIPQSAISTTSAATFFDPEEQTEPPRPESLSGTLTIDQDLGIMGLNQAQTATETEDSEQSSPLIRRQTSYHSPFDEDGMDDENVSIKISLDASAQSSPQLTPTRTDFDREHSIPSLTDLAIPSSTNLPTLIQDEYEPQPYTYSSPTYQTTVTILGPENDFRPSYKDQYRDTMPASDLLQADESSGVETFGALAHGHTPSAGTRPEELNVKAETFNRLEGFYVGPHLQDNIASLRDSVLTSSDPDVSYDNRAPSVDFDNAFDTSRNLTLPAFLIPSDRLSQHSAWTDFSVGSEDHETGPTGPSSQSRDLETREANIISHPTKDSSMQQPSSQDVKRSPGLSPQEGSDMSSSKLAAGPFLNEDHGPEDDTGEEVAIAYSQESQKIPAFPNHTNPHPFGPQSPPYVADYDMDGSAYMSGTRPNSYLHSQGEESEDLAQTVSTPRSTGQLSLETLEVADPSHTEDKAVLTEAHDFLDKEHKRLRQRHLVIRELIDTEEIFVRDMSVVEEIYKDTAAGVPNLDSKTIKLIFRNTDDIIVFHSSFLAQLKEGASSVYTPKTRKTPVISPQDSKDSDSTTLHSTHSSRASGNGNPELNDARDRQTSIGPLFSKNIDQLKVAYEAYLRSSDQSSKRLVQIQQDESVKVWLTACNEVASELTTAWNLDSLLIKPMQRITKYPDIITHLLKHTPADHPDYEPLVNARATVMDTIDEINKSKKNFELVGQIVGNRKRKDSDVRAGIARAFVKRVDKLQASNNKPAEDESFMKLHERFADDYLRLQVVLRDVEFYTRNVATYVHEFLRYLSSMELVMRLQPSRDYSHIESKWVQFNVSMRDIEKIALEKHLSDVRKHVIEPFEQVIRCYGNPSLAMKKRAKRRLDYEKSMQLKANGKKVDKQLAELVEQYEALNDTLKKELPKLSALTAQIGNICLGKFVSIQATWFSIWKEKVRAPLQDSSAHIPELADIVGAFQREFMLQEERANSIGILNPALKGRTSQSTTDDASSTFSSKMRSRPGDLLSPRGRGLSVNSDYIPSLPTPDFGKRNSGQFALSPTGILPSPSHYYRDYYSGTNGHARGSSRSPIASDYASSSRVAPSMSARPSTGRSIEAPSLPRQSSDSTAQSVGLNRHDSTSTFNSNYHLPEPRRLSGLFHSALPLPDGPEESQRSSRASSRERGPPIDTYRVLWLAASLFEFNIETTKIEAGYPYLTYQAGEIFDVLAEKGELWLAKNQDDKRHLVGWIWSKHFAKLADS
ncbi:hypothetical protein B0T17DRAFT_495921 [Bombardia bombarda]|uniref:DH domain-containing protein n=1 Tax=Bombardia bombarda TaxID=252184 RepID=A0AA39WMY3_9PEZI|nr:hypothetical protein B0T17DRAFT_495921 [Bombardia bombarda]